MADIDIQKKKHHGWLWLLGLAALALLGWLLFAGDDDEDVVAAAPVVAPVTVAEPVVAEVQPLPPGVNTPAPVAAAPGIVVSEIINSPATWTGKTVGGEVRVVEVVSDRGFWIEDQGERLFMLINEVPGEIKDINAGQTLRISEAMVYSAQDMAKIPGTMEPDAQKIAQAQPVVLAADSRNIQILTVPSDRR
jgi:hypothetical protein